VVIIPEPAFIRYRRLLLSLVHLQKKSICRRKRGSNHLSLFCSSEVKNLFSVDRKTSGRGRRFNSSLVTAKEDNVNAFTMKLFEINRKSASSAKPDNSLAPNFFVRGNSYQGATLCRSQSTAVTMGAVQQCVYSELSGVRFSYTMGHSCPHLVLVHLTVPVTLESIRFTVHHLVERLKSGERGLGTTPDSSVSSPRIALCI